MSEYRDLIEKMPTDKYRELMGIDVAKKDSDQTVLILKRDQEYYPLDHPQNIEHLKEHYWALYPIRVEYVRAFYKAVMDSLDKDWRF